MNYPANDPQVAPFFGNIDIGADEVGELTMGGFVPSTRIYCNGSIPNAPLATGHGQILFFNPIQGSPYTRPRHNALVGWGFGWFDHVQNAPDAVAGTNYTDVAPPPVVAERTVAIAVGYPLIMRGLQCDFSPSLLPDAHPFWPLLILLSGTGALSALDPYAANPWFSTGILAMPVSTKDNPSLFHNLTGPVSHRGTSGTMLYYATGVMEATLNPPGTFLFAGQFLVLPGGQFGPFGSCASGATYSIGPWGFGDSGAGCPDVLPFYSTDPTLGTRVNCEVGPGASNLQTFLIIPQVDEAMALRGVATRRQEATVFTREAIREMLERVRVVRR